jgi:hypothetical protein
MYLCLYCLYYVSVFVLSVLCICVCIVCAMYLCLYCLYYVSVFVLSVLRGQGVMVGVTGVAVLLKGDYGDP